MPSKKSQSLFDINECLEALAEKKAASRGKALLEVCEAARKDLLGQIVGTCLEALVSNIVACLKKGAKSEALDACNALQAVLVACHEQATEIFEENLYSLGLQLRSHRSDSVRAKVAGVIALGSLVCGQDEESLTRIMQRLSGYFVDSSTEVHLTPKADIFWRCSLFVIQQLPDLATHCCFGRRSRRHVYVLGRFWDRRYRTACCMCVADCTWTTLRHRSKARTPPCAWRLQRSPRPRAPCTSIPCCWDSKSCKKSTSSYPRRHRRRRRRCSTRQRGDSTLSRPQPSHTKMTPHPPLPPAPAPNLHRRRLTETAPRRRRGIPSPRRTHGRKCAPRRERRVAGVPTLRSGG